MASPLRSLLIAACLLTVWCASAGAQPSLASVTPVFLEIAPGDWRGFPSTGGYVAVQPGSLLLRSGDGRRSLVITLPEAWSVRGEGSTPTRFTRIGRAGTVALPASTRLRYDAPDGRSGADVQLAAGGVLWLAVDSASPSDWPDVMLDVHGECADGEVSLPPHLGSAALGAWAPMGSGRFRLSPPAEASDGTAVVEQQLVFGTFLGGASGEAIQDMAVNAEGLLVLGGQSASLDFPILAGAFDSSSDRSGDIFLAGMTPHGNTLEFATFFGGTGFESCRSLAIDLDGTVVIAGRVESPDLPTSPGAFDATFNGVTEDTFVARLAGDGSALLGCTYIGGSGLGDDHATHVRIDPLDGSIVIAGRTCSVDWPTTPDSFAPENASFGDCDVFLSRISPDLSVLLASTYFGGVANDWPGGMDLLADGSVVFSGINTTGDAPISPSRGVFPNATSSDKDYLVRLVPDLSAQSWSTWVPGGIERVLATDSAIVLVGSTVDPLFPITAGAAIPSFTGTGAWFACSITPDALAILWSTYITTSHPSSGVTDAALDAQGRVYVSGRAHFGSAIPFTPDAFDTTLTGLYEGVIIVLDPVGSEVLYASLLGGGDGVLPGQTTAIEPDGCAGAYVAGWTYGGAFPVTPGAFDETHNGGSDAWILRITTFSPWIDLGQALLGSNGRPALAPSAPLCGGDPGSLDLAAGPSAGNAFLVLGASQLSAPFKGGTLVPSPDLLLGPLPLDGQGAASLAFTWPSGLPSGLDLWIQAWMPDAAAPKGFSASNGVQGTTP